MQDRMSFLIIDHHSLGAETSLARNCVHASFPRSFFKYMVVALMPVGVLGAQQLSMAPVQCRQGCFVYRLFG